MHEDDKKKQKDLVKQFSFCRFSNTSKILIDNILKIVGNINQKNFDYACLILILRICMSFSLFLHDSTRNFY